MMLCDEGVILNWSHQIERQMPNLVPRENNHYNIQEYLVSHSHVGGQLHSSLYHQPG